MTAFNIVKMTVKAGQEKEFLARNKEMMGKPMRGGRAAHLVRIGERQYCFIGEWDDMSDIVAARAEMVATLDQFRGLLEDLGGGKGVTDPASGTAVLSQVTRGTEVTSG